LLAGQSPEPDLHRDILNQKGVRGTTFWVAGIEQVLDPLAIFRPSGFGRLFLAVITAQGAQETAENGRKPRSAPPQPGC
jgi:hypothetical protein